MCINFTNLEKLEKNDFPGFTLMQPMCRFHHFVPNSFVPNALVSKLGELNHFLQGIKFQTFSPYMDLFLYLSSCSGIRQPLWNSCNNSLDQTDARSDIGLSTTYRCSALFHFGVLLPHTLASYVPLISELQLSPNT